MRLWVLFALGFFVLGLPFLGLTGLHMDAALELVGWYGCAAPEWSSEIAGRRVPWMAMTYLGAVKSWLYQPLLAFLPASVWVLRLPLLLAGAGCIALFFILLERTIGRRAAIAGTLLLGTDVSFVLSAGIDFGPVVGLHLLWLAGVLLLVRFEQSGKLWLLALSFLCFGVAMWHKALFIWMLGGLGIAGLVAYPRRVWSQVTSRRVVLATAAFVIGALPLIVYNVKKPLRTFRIADVAGTDAPLSHKLLILRRTLDGSVMLGFLTEEAWPETWKAPTTAVEKASVSLSKALQGPSSTMLPWLVAAAALLTPWLLVTRARAGVLFCWTYVAVVWGQMAIVGKTGGSVHHVLLLWPVPHLLLVLAGREVGGCRRWGAWLTTACLIGAVGGNLLLLNRYFADLSAQGATAVLTDAVETLRSRLENYRNHGIITVDWGYQATLCLQSKGSLPVTALRFDDGPLLEQRIRATRMLFVAHSPEAEMIPGIHERLRTAARRIGYEREVAEVVWDRNGRPRFEIWRFEPRYVPVTASELRMGDPAHDVYLRGVWEIEAGAWRWTAREFSARLAMPSRQPVDLEVDLHVPEVIVTKLGPLQLAGRVGAESLESKLLSTAGDYRLRWPVGGKAGAVVEVSLELSKALPPSGAETRELGVIVRGIGLKSR